MELKDAQAHCLAIAQAHYENFPVASRLLRRDRRLAVAAVYCFARQADDYADEAAFGTPSERLALLDAWEAKLDAPAGDPVFIALADARERFGIPRGLLTDLLSAFRQDVSVREYADFAAVADYCRRSADPVGRLVLAVHGRLEPGVAALSDRICTALQLANFWQDLGRDIAERGRLYLPLDEVDRFKVSRDDLRRLRFKGELRSLMQFQVARTRGMFLEGAALPGRLGGLLGLEVKLTLLGGLEILRGIERLDHDTLHQRPALGKRAWLGLLLRSMLPVRA